MVLLCVPILCILAAVFYYAEFHNPQSMTRLLGACVRDILKDPNLLTVSSLVKARNRDTSTGL